jgi:hypothetical protein
MDCIHMPPPGIPYTGKLYITGETVTALIGPFALLRKESPELVLSRNSRDVMKVIVELDDSCTGLLKKSLCFTEGFPVNYLKDKNPGDVLTFTALSNYPMKLTYMGIK